MWKWIRIKRFAAICCPLKMIGKTHRLSTIVFWKRGVKTWKTRVCFSETISRIFVFLVFNSFASSSLRLVAFSCFYLNDNINNQADEEFLCLQFCPWNSHCCCLLVWLRFFFGGGCYRVVYVLQLDGNDDDENMKRILHVEKCLKWRRKQPSPNYSQANLFLSREWFFYFYFHVLQHNTRRRIYRQKKRVK